jgi:hypothetical protein
VCKQCLELRTRVCVPFVVVVWALLLTDKLLVGDFLELDHFGCVLLVQGSWRGSWKVTMAWKRCR